MLQDFEKCVKNNGTDAFNEDGQQLYKDIRMKRAWLRRDPNDDMGK